MRKRILGVAGLAVVLFTASAALAVPSLQLDIEGGVYDWNTETIVATSSTFTLYALLVPNRANSLDYDDYFISAALSPKTAPPGGPLGSFSFSGTNVAVTGGMTYGTPPAEAYPLHDPGDLAPHGIFSTYYREFGFRFDGGGVETLDYSYNSQTGEIASGTMYRVPFLVEVASLDPGYQIHFDLYNAKAGRSYPGDIDIEWFAPFSHDAQSAPVPEPGTFILLGVGLIGIASFGRKRFAR